MNSIDAPSIRDLLHDAADRLALAGVDSPRLDARILLAHAMGVSRDDLIAASCVPTAPETEIYRGLIARRAGREPLAYIIGRKEFWSLDFRVGPGVLVPRPETETLIETALTLFPDRAAPLAIADLGAGSAALLVAALTEFPGAHGSGFERSPDAMPFARANISAHGLDGRAKIIPADWNQAPSESFDLVLSNPPYVPTAEIAGLAPDVRLYEPHAALDGGPDGLEAYRTLAKLLPGLLRPGGVALLELGLGQAKTLETMFQGLVALRVAPDLAGIPRVLVLKRPN